ncbi:MAG: YraN family protein [Vicinamibacterales bacterium]
MRVLEFPADDRQSAGKLGEDLAAVELWHQGYAILARRYRTRYGEIDIVAQDGDTVVFVEVRARRTERCGSAAESITRSKQRRLAAMALDYLAWCNNPDAPCRFDVVAIDGVGGDQVKLTHIKDAFYVE